MLSNELKYKEYLDIYTVSPKNVPLTSFFLQQWDFFGPQCIYID